MAIGRGIRPRSSWIRRVGKMRAAGGDLMEPRGGGELKAGGRGIRGRTGDASLRQVVNAGDADSKIDNASRAGSAPEGWIYVRGHLIDPDGNVYVRDPDRNVYVPDSEDEESEDEESGMGDQACGRHVSAGTDVAMDLNPQVHDAAAFGPVGVEMAPDAAEDQAAHKDLPIQDRPMLVHDEDSRVKEPIEVPEQLKEVLANIDPIYHDVFVSMYKILVPICFR